MKGLWRLGFRVWGFRFKILGFEVFGFRVGVGLLRCLDSVVVGGAGATPSFYAPSQTLIVTCLKGVLTESLIVALTAALASNYHY